jgi:hypothetical protein
MMMEQCDFLDILKLTNIRLSALLVLRITEVLDFVHRPKF